MEENSATKIPWYKKVYKGAKAQKLWQVSIGSSVFLTFVVLPVWVEYLTALKDKRFIGKSSSNNNIQQMVYEKRIELRNKLKLEK